MPLVAIVSGIILIPIGLVIFDQTGREHYTSLIPAGLGALLVMLGGLAYLPNLRKHAMHVAAMIGTFGVLGVGFRFGQGLAGYLSSGEVKSPPALVGTGLTTLVCLIFVALCVNSFIQARRRQRKAGG